MAILVTGASGFVGQSLIPKLLNKGHKVYGLYRQKAEPGFTIHKFAPLFGDITKPALGIEELPGDIDAVYHLAGITNLRREDKDGLIWRTNVVGTQNVIDFCTKQNISSLFFCSTAYTVGEGRNPYEKSKIMCERMIGEADIPNKVIFKPSVIMGENKFPFLGHFSQFAVSVARFHHRAEIIRRWAEAKLRLPVIIQPVFRIRGDPQGRLNLIGISEVAQAMASIERPGVYWLTNKTPPLLKDLVTWVGETLLLDMRIEQNFEATPLEAQFAKWAAPFQPYLEGDNFPSDIGSCPITKEFIKWTVLTSLLKA